MQMQVNEQKSVTIKVDKLSGASRVKEIASLISGKEITSAGIKQAEVLLEDG